MVACLQVKELFVEVIIYYWITSHN